MTGKIQQYEYSDQTLLLIYEAIEWIEKNKTLRDKIHSLGNLEVSYRQINHWEEMGLLNDSRNVLGKGWRKFSFYDMTYILILKQLRQIGMSIEQLRNTKKSLFAAVVAKRSDITLIEIATAFIYLKNYGNSHLLVEPDGTAHFMPMEDFCHYKRLNLLPAVYILLNVNQILNQHISLKSEETLPVRTDIICVLDEQEADVIYNMRRDTGVDKMTIGLINEGKRENWSPTLEQEFSVKPDNKEGLHNIISSLGNGKLTLTVRNSQVVNTRVNKRTKKQ